jgi:uncharacterized membrane protein YgcG
MTRWWQPALVLVTCTLVFAQFADALAQDNADSSKPVETGNAQDEDVGGFWNWVKENIEVENPEDSSHNTRPREIGRDGDSGGGGGGDSGGGGGHGG